MEIKNNIKFSSIKIINSLLSQFIFLLLLYILSIDNFGHLISIISVSVLLQVVTTGFTYGAFINFSTKYFYKTMSYSTILYYRLITTVFVALFIVFIFSFFNFEDKFYILKLYVGLIFYDLGSQFLLPGKKRLLQVVIELFFFIILFVIVIFNIENFEQYIDYYLFLSLSLFLYSFLTFYNLCNSELSKINIEEDDIVEYKYFLKYSLWQLVGILGIYIMGNGLNLYTYFYNFSASDIAKYGIILKIFMSLSPIYGLFVIFVPKMMRNKYFLKYDKMPYIKTLLILSTILTSLYFVIIIILQEVIIYFNKLEYTGIYEFLKLLIPAYFFMSFSNLANSILANTNKFKYPQFIFIFQSIILVILYIVLIPLYKLDGFVISVTITYLISSLLFLHTLLKGEVNLI